MSNYAIVTNFLSKDSLISGNPLKAVKGADFTTEFTAVQTAVNSKFDGLSVFAPDGNAAQPSFGFTNNAGTGVYNSAGALGFATGATNRFTLSAAGGLFSLAVTGGDKGAGTINAAGLFVGGVAVTAGGVSSITGTANQIAASASTGAVTLSLPQNVIVPTAAAGVALTLNGLAGANTLSLTGSANKALAVDRIGSVVSRLQFYVGDGTAGSVSDDAYIVGNATALHLGVAGTSATSLLIDSAGKVTVSAPSSGIALNVSGVASTYTARITAGAGAGVSFGLDVLAGTNASDQCLRLLSQNAGTTFAVVSGTGGFLLGSATGGDQGLGTLNATGLFINGVAVSAGAAVTTGSFTGTLATGGTTTPTMTCKYTKVGNTVTLRIAATTYVSNATGMTLTGLPAAIQPATAVHTTASAAITNNGNQQAGDAFVSGGTMTFATGTAGSYSTSGFTGSGTKGFIGDAVFVWDLN